jgi:hypothetical protein
MANQAKRSFAGGEIAPSLYARTDTAKYQTALRLLRNFFIHRHGGISNRGGTRFIEEVKDSSQTVRLVPFVFNDEQTYLLEFGHFYIRFVQDGVQLESSPGVPYEIVTPYTEADLMELRFVQSADVITITHHNYAPRELSRLADTNWTLEAIVFGPSIGTVANLAMGGGTAGSSTYYAVTAVDEVTGEEGLAAFVNGAIEPSTGTPITLTWDALSGASQYRVYRSTDGGVTYELLRNAGGTPTEDEDSTWIDDIADITTSTEGSWQASVDSAENNVGAATPFDGRFFFHGIITVTCSVQGAASGRLQAYYSRDGEPDVLAGTIASGGCIGDGVSGAAFSENFTGSIVVPDNGYAALVLKVVPEVWGANGAVGEVYECFADFQSGLAAYKRITWSVIGTGFSDDGSEGDALQSPPRDRHLFETSSGWPLTVGIYQQRRLLGNTIDRPEEIYASRTGAYSNFLVSTPLQDDDAVTWSMAGRKVNRVMHLLDLGELIVFTSGNAMRVNGDEAGILRPDAINPTKFSASGIGTLPPIEIIDSALYLQARGSIVRDIQPLQTAEGYKSSDVTLYAAHLLRGQTIVDWAYAETPDSVIWAVRDDGVLLGLTYLPEEAIWGWHQHNTDGVVERVCTVPEGDEDAVYLVVRRTINSVTKRYIERLESRQLVALADSFFVDCGITYSGASQSTITGLSHLEGKRVSVLSAGVVVANPNRPVSEMAYITVSGGQITLPAATTKAQIGLPYMADVETLDIDTASGRSLKEGRMLTGRVLLSLADSQGGIHIGQSAPDGADPLEDLTELELESAALVTDTFSADSIVADWNGNARIFVRQVDPLPATILAAIPQGYM